MTLDQINCEDNKRSEINKLLNSWWTAFFINFTFLFWSDDNFEKNWQKSSGKVQFKKRRKVNDSCEYRRPFYSKTNLMKLIASESKIMTKQNSTDDTENVDSHSSGCNISVKFADAINRVFYR